MEVWLSWTAVSVAAVTLYWLKLHYAARHGVRSGRDSKREIEDVAELRAELRESYDDLAAKIEQLNERLDFAERVLAERANQARLERP
jgi:uncharacterized protein YlxW (UPF0749 family)